MAVCKVKGYYVSAHTRKCRERKTPRKAKKEGMVSTLRKKYEKLAKGA